MTLTLPAGRPLSNGAWNRSSKRPVDPGYPGLFGGCDHNTPATFIPVSSPGVIGGGRPALRRCSWPLAHRIFTLADPYDLARPADLLAAAGRACVHRPGGTLTSQGLARPAPIITRSGVRSWPGFPEAVRLIRAAGPNAQPE